MADKNINKSIVLFEDAPVRREWIKKEEKWYFAIVDIIAILTQSASPGAYWRKLKERLLKEGNESVTNCHTLKMQAKDGKMRKIDVADVETVFRLVQSIPSKKAEPFKLWLAKVGYQRLQEIANPELAVNRARDNWKKMGAPEKWIEQRMRGQETRNKLTDYWRESEVKEGSEYAKLTNIIHQEWSGLTTRQHKNLKGLGKENLRDAMTEAELIFTALAELSTTQIAKKDESRGYNQNAQSAQKGGGIAKSARKQLEKATGQKIVSAENYLAPVNKNKELN